MHIMSIRVIYLIPQRCGGCLRDVSVMELSEGGRWGGWSVTMVYSSGVEFMSNEADKQRHVYFNANNKRKQKSDGLISENEMKCHCTSIIISGFVLQINARV